MAKITFQYNEIEDSRQGQQTWQTALIAEINQQVKHWRNKATEERGDTNSTKLTQIKGGNVEKVYCILHTL